MSIIKKCFFFYCLVFSINSLAETDSETKTGYISDELFIYMHSGAGNNYRILGTVNSGAIVGLTGQQANEYSQIVDETGKLAWVESKFVSTTPGIRQILIKLENQLTASKQSQAESESALVEANSKIAELTSANIAATEEIVKLKEELITVKSQLKSQDTDILLQWFYKGAGVLAIGLILGLLLPLFFGKKRRSNSWT